MGPWALFPTLAAMTFIVQYCTRCFVYRKAIIWITLELEARDHVIPLVTRHPSKYCVTAGKLLAFQAVAPACIKMTVWSAFWLVTRWFAVRMLCFACRSLASRSFKTARFLDSFQLDPVGLGFFQARWDKSVSSTFTEILGNVMHCREYEGP